MAVIQKIRDRYAKWAGGAIALSLIIFVLQQALEGDSTIKNLFKDDGHTVAKVNGEKIQTKDYEENVSDYMMLTELYRKGQPLTDADRAQIKQSVLDQMVMEQLIADDAQKLGIADISEAEEKDMFRGSNPDQAVAGFPYFQNQQGQFDPSLIKQFEDAVKKGGKSAEENEFLVKAGKQWQALQRLLKRGRVLQKYTSLLANADYTPKFILEAKQTAASMQAGVRFVKVPFTSVDDSKTKVTDADLKAYMEKHKAQFSTDQPTRSLDYVVYDLAPNADDTLKAKGVLAKEISDFAATTDNEKFVSRNSDGSYDDNFVIRKAFMSPFADTLFAQPVGSVYGPYFEAGATGSNGTYKITKIVAKKMVPDSVKCRHILIQTARQGQAVLDSNIAKARIDSISKAIASGADFNALAAKYSDDEGSKTKGGEYDFSYAQRSGPNGISKEFGDFIFDGKTGEKKVVQVSNANYSGYHYIEILSQKNEVAAAKFATVSKDLITSTTSQNATLSLANNFAGRNNNAKAFDDAVKKENLNKRVAEAIKPGDFTIQGLGNARELIRWAYEGKEGEVSNPILIDNKHYVVAKISAVQEPGLEALSTNLRAQLEGTVKNEQKAKMIADQYKSATTLEAIAQTSGQQVQVADSLKGNASFAQGIGYEPKVLGYAFNESFGLNKLSPAIKGHDGVFFIMVTHRNPITLNDGEKMGIQAQASMEAQQNKGYIGQMLTEALRRNGKVTYNPQNIR